MTHDEASWPTDWRSVPLWSLFRRIKDVGHPDEQMLSVFRDHGVVPKASRSDNFNKTAPDRSIYQLVDEGWLVINRMKAWHGSLGISPYRGIVSGHYICFLPEHGEDHRFLNFLFRSDIYTAELRRMSRGVRPSQIEIDNDGLRVLQVHLPSVGEQRAIADFLDTETARIDALISKKQRLARLVSVRSQRAASSILGMARPPESQQQKTTDSWPAPKLRHVAAVHGGLTLGKRPPGPPVLRPYVRVANVQDGHLDLSQVHEVEVDPADVQRYELRPGDLLVLEGNGNPENLGRGCLWRGEIEGCLHQNHVHVVRPDPRVLLPEFLDQVLRTDGAREFFGGGIDQVSIATLSQSRLGSLPIPIPPLGEQAALVDRIQRIRSKAQAVRETLERQLRLLREHRQALITAAVTGEFEVPGVAA